MKALQLVHPRKFELVEAPVPTLKSGSSDRILVRTRWVSLCGSDIPFFSGKKQFSSYPMAIGAPVHECVGQVVESTSEHIAPGEWVIAIPDGNQALAEFFISRVSKAATLSPDLGNSPASCLIQPLSTVINAVDRLGSVEGCRIGVVGLGSIGLFFCWLLLKRGARRIVGIDPNLARCQLAEGLGISKTYATRSADVEQLARGDSWEPNDICIEAVGHQMDTINDCFNLIRKRGVVVAFGVPDQNVYSIEYETFFRKNAVLMASVTPEWQEYLAKSRDVFTMHQNELEQWVTHTLPISGAESAFNLYEHRADGIIKVVLDASSW